jgi:ABC-type glycerol-3-phosphate transport system substrate-binding protein
MACLYKEGSLEDAVRDCNRLSTEWYVTIKDYSDGQAVTTEVQDRAITALNLDVVSGNMPDLIAVQTGIPFRSYGEKGVLRDLTSDLETEGIELLPQIQRAGTVDGKLVAVCGSFALLTAAGNRDMLGDAAGWSAADAMALADSLPERPSVFSGSMTRDGFMNWLSYYLEGFLDWESGIVSFDTPEFRDMLTLAAALPADMPAENSADADVMEGRALVNPTAITSVQGWQVQDVICLGKLSTPGFPTGDGVGNLIYMQMPLAVSSNSSHIEGAMAFLRSILNDDSQNAVTDLFPSARPAFERQLAEAMREPSPEDGFTKVYNLPAGGQFLDPTVYLWENENEPQPRSILYWVDETGGTYREEKVYAMSEEQRERLLALLESAERAASYDKVIAGIVQEEAGAFFAGQRDIETVSRQIQSRAETYLAEQR